MRCAQLARLDSEGTGLNAAVLCLVVSDVSEPCLLPVLEAVAYSSVPLNCVVIEWDQIGSEAETGG